MSGNRGIQVYRFVRALRRPENRCPWRSHPNISGKGTSLQNEFDIIFGLVTAVIMNLDDFNKPVENGDPLPFSRSDWLPFALSISVKVVFHSHLESNPLFDV